MKIHRPGLSKSGSPPPLTISQSQAPRTANCGVVHTLFSAEGCSARVKNPTRTRGLTFGLLRLFETYKPPIWGFAKNSRVFVAEGASAKHLIRKTER